MAEHNPILLPLALRVYPQAANSLRNPKSRKKWRLPKAMLVFDTETRTDATQSLTFGSYRFLVEGRCLEEGLFYGDDLPASDRRILEKYSATHLPETVSEGVRELKLLTRSQFVDRLYTAVYKGRCLLVGFNLPFDLSRIACDFAAARRQFVGGFSLGLWSYADETGSEKSDHYRPRVCIKHIDSKRALKGLTSRNSPDNADLIPEDSETGKPQAKYIFRGHFLDLRTLAFALTDKGYSLKTACKAFGVEHGKGSVSRHGVVSEEYIDYNRRDVLATAELAEKLLEEYAKHPISLQVTTAFSPASIGKGYLREMGIEPIMERQQDFPREFLGYAQSAFFGGRASAHIRKIAVPVVYTDFLSMYPTVNSLMGLWPFVIAREVKVVKHCKAKIENLLSTISADDLFNPATWKKLTGFVKLIPDGDILPTRATYSVETNDWQVAVNHLYAESENPDRSALWFSLPDVVASVIRNGRVPKIVDAFRLEPIGTLGGLKPTKLRGMVDVGPANQDFFKVVIEERKRLDSRSDLGQTEKDRLNKALKVLANAASYGIYAEMIRREADDKVHVTCFGIDPESFTCRVQHPDDPGEYCFPPLASLITGAARLMLALLEHCVTELGGTYAMEDTDSMAIVATQKGGLIPCPGGNHLTSSGAEAVRALSWKQVQQISDRFAALNPYHRDAIPGSILKIEDDNYDLTTRKQRQLYCVAISAKRYALFLKDEYGHPVLLREGVNNKTNRWSRHGLGHLLNPSDPNGEDREWMGQVWLNIIRRTMGLPTHPLPFENLPAVGRVSVTSPAAMKPLLSFNQGKPYSDQIKPFNFILTCQVKQLGHPIGTDPEHFHLIAPYDDDSRRWLKFEWIDQYTGERRRITTTGYHGGHGIARVRTYGEILREYEFHPEAKCADACGEICGKQAFGLLQRRHVGIERIRYIGKESNKLEEVDAGMVHSPESVYTEYCDPKRDEWVTKILSILKKTPLSVLTKETGLSRRALISLRVGDSRPRRKNWELIASILRKLGLV